MSVFEFDAVYGVFEETSIISLFSSAFPDANASWLNALSAGISLHCQNPSAEITADAVMEKASVSETELTAAVKFWIKKGILRKTAYKAPKYKYTDPVPLDPNLNTLNYNPFAQAVSDEFRPYRKANPYEIQMACSWKTYPGLQEDVILEILRQTLELNPDAGVKSAEALLPFVKDAATRQEAANLLADYKENYSETQKVLRILGQRREPTDRELELYLKWKTEWEFTFEAIQKACDATNAGDPTFDYLNGILRNIYDAAHPKARMDTAAVEESFKLTQELKELKKHIGGFSITKQRIAEYKTLKEHYDLSLIQLAARACGVENKGFDDIGKLLLRWEDTGITSVASAAAFLRERNAQMDILRDLFDQWGISRKPGSQDLRLVRQWLDAGFSREMILKAAEYAFAADDPMLYTAKVLGKFREKGINTPEQADADHEQHARDMKEKAQKERRQKEVDALKALGANGPYAGQRKPEEQEDLDDFAFRRMMELMNMNDE